ncbi:para-nitrobenzyl esterase [Nitrospirillum amazonense]|uniref:Carboxylic ester hydrolase n=1 Tax=Nitrospirillum amazonense TaxID=28077 RepID=A0A560JLH9_9PROT|nr:carboxylesterase family protein [Nitrospirillum amazonense]TWB69170.1 para-nitrobenzyl esterase [Nitrospirillum amazonense]
MRLFLRLGACAAAALMSLGALAEDNPTVRAPAGTVAGRSSGDLNVFKGIPYAKPPVGPLRWKAPESLPAWTGVRDAGAPGLACVQPRAAGTTVYTSPPPAMGEDCLTLNITAPKRARNAPVLVWIHGGTLLNGYGFNEMYDGAALARRGVIVVSINYRLSVLGYMAYPGLSAENPDGISGNYGLLDQIAALRWIHDNIAAFGGDAANVTVSGESAGALSVMYLMASPKAKGLFAKAVVESGYMISMPELKQPNHGEFAAEAIGSYIAGQVGATDVAALRAMDAETLVQAAAKVNYFPLGTVDGKVLTGQLVDVFDKGEQAPVPILTGFNSGEIRSLRWLIAPPPADAKAYEAMIRERYGDLADEFLRLYPATGKLEESELAATRDALYGWTAERLVRDQTRLGQPGYLYLFDHGYPAMDDKGLHSFHASEIPYVFGTMAHTPSYWPKAPDSPVEQRLTAAMSDYWASFARDGKPVAEGVPAWPVFGKDEGYMAFTDTAQPGRRVMPGMYALHEATVCRRRAAGNLPWNWNTGVVSPVLPPHAEGC